MAAVTAGVVGSLAAGAIAAKGATSAAGTQARAADAATDEQRRQYDQTREDMAPWRAAGEGALGNLLNPQESFQSSPGYGYALDQSEQALMRQRSATGGLASGNTLAALQNNAIGLANQDYGNWWNQQMGLAGVGQNATNQLAAIGQNTASNIGNTMMASGAAQASGIQGSANAWSNAFGNVAGFAGYGLGGRSTPSAGIGSSTPPIWQGPNYDMNAANSPWNRRNLLGVI